jgi:uncharacterized protein YaeQ
MDRYRRTRSGSNQKSHPNRQSVRVYSFNSKSNVWWMQEQAKFTPLSAAIFQFSWPNIQALAKLVQRTMDISVTITEESAYVATESGECEVGWVVLKD